MQLNRCKLVSVFYSLLSILLTLSILYSILYPCVCVCVYVLQQWEVSVVSRLDWGLASVVPSDFLEPILHALPFVQPHHLKNMRRNVHAYIALAATGELHN